MYRFVAVGFSIIVITLSIIGLQNPAGALSVVMSTSPWMAILRITLALGLLVYSIFPHFRYDLTHKAMLLAGPCLIWFFLVSLFADTYPFPEPIDFFFGIEGAALALIAGLEFERPKAVQKLMPNITALELLVAKARKLHLPAFPSQRKPA